MGTVTTLRPGSGRLSPAEAVHAYLATVNAASTRRTYKLILEAFAEHFSDVPGVDGIGGDGSAAWFTGKWGERSESRWNVCLNALRSAYSYWLEQEWVTGDATRRLRRRKVPVDRDRALTRTEVEQLLTRKDIALREKTLWTLLYESAARSAEVLRLDAGDLDLANRCARVVRKGGDVDLITWQSRTATLLPRLLKGRRTGPVFVTDRRVRSDVPRSLADVDPDTGRGRLTYATAQELFKTATGGRTLHQLRHSALSHLAETGANTSMMMAISGHTSVRSLARYAKVSREALLKYRAETDPARKR